MRDDRSANAPVDDEPRQAFDLFVILGRLRAFFLIVAQSLRGEFLHEDKAINDWLNTLEWLEDSYFPVYQYFRGTALSGQSFVRSTAGRVACFKNELMEGRKMLLESSLSPILRLFELLNKLERIHEGFALWQTDLKRDLDISAFAQHAEVGSMQASLAPSAADSLRQAIDELRSAIESKDEINACLASRRVIFLMYYTFITHPDEWTSELHQRVLNLHDQAIEVLPSGLARQSISARRERLKTHDQQRFEEYALSLAA